MHGRLAQHPRIGAPRSGGDRRQIGIAHRLVRTRELRVEAYARNDLDRCYVCKGIVFARLEEVAREAGAGTILYGQNVDDTGDYRPGARAAVEAGVRAPLVEAGLTKPEVREIAKALGLPNYDKPAAPCLSTRIPYGQRVTVDKLRQIGAAEEAIRKIGVRDLRVRHHGDVARIELLLSDLPLLLDEGNRAAVVRDLQAIGFRFVTVDIAGLRSGSLNVGVVPATAPERRILTVVGNE